MIIFALLCGTLWVIWWVYAFFAYRPRPIAGATVVVTGACSEVGRRLCVQFYARGARVIAWDYSRIKLQELQSEVQRLGEASGGTDTALTSANSSSSASPDSNFVIAAVDASSRLQVQRAAKEIEGRVDIIINAAHSCPAKPLHDRADDSVERVFQTNLVSALLVVRQLLPQLLSTGGRGSASASSSSPGVSWRRRDDYAQVVNVVSAAGNYTLAAHAPDYAASQWGMVGLHYSMRSWIAGERAAYRATRAKTAGTAASGVSGGGGGGSVREVRTTLLCIDDIQNGIPTALTAALAPASAMLGGAKAPTSLGSPARNAEGGSSSLSLGSPNARAARDGYAASLQKRSAEVDRVVASCIAAICRGQERYCCGSSWRTPFLYPVAMACPVPWAERMLRWMQRTPTTTITTQAE